MINDHLYLAFFTFTYSLLQYSFDCPFEKKLSLTLRIIPEIMNHVEFPVHVRLSFFQTNISNQPNQ